MKKPNASMASVLAACHAISAGAHAAQPEDRSAVEGGAVTLPIDLDNKFAYVFVTLNGKEVRLKFDLGNSSPLALQQSVLQVIDATDTGESTTLLGVGGPFESRKYSIASVKIGTHVFNDVEAWTDPERPGYRPEQHSGGFLGTGLLKSYVIVLDYPRRTMTLAPGSSDSASRMCEGASVPFSSSPKWRGEAVTTARTDLGELTLWWDTGAPLSALRSTAVAKARSGADDSALVTRQFSLGDADFGPWKFDLWEMNLPGFDGFIGYDFFARRVVCVDYPRKRVVIQKR